MSTPSETPRTDAVGRLYAKVSKSEQSMENVELYGLARSLERELSACRAREEKLREALRNCMAVMGEAAPSLADAVRQLTDEELGKMWVSVYEQARAALGQP